jgi:hypothetical protein
VCADDSVEVYDQASVCTGICKLFDTLFDWVVLSLNRHLDKRTRPTQICELPLRRQLFMNLSVNGAGFPSDHHSRGSTTSSLSSSHS